MHDPTSGDTIAAPITAPGQAAVAAVRLSGGQTQRILSKLLDKPGKLLSRPRSLQLLQVLDFVSGNEAELLDTALCAYFPAPNSFTGEDCLEFHLHGSPFVVRRLMENLCAAGARLAEPGEFTQRAFLNGRMDLSQAEAVADVIAAETEAQARVAQQQLAGKLHDAIDTLGEPLRNLLAEIEAFIDFPLSRLVSHWTIVSRRSPSRACRYTECWEIKPDECLGGGNKSDSNTNSGHHPR